MEEEKFSDKVWFTYHARIEAEKRLRRNDFLSQICLIWISFVLVMASYFSISESSSFKVGVVHLLSIAVLVISVFVSGRGFASRAIYMRQCYENLGRMFAEVKMMEYDAESSALDSFAARYGEILGISENHSTCDYYWAIIKLRWAKARCTKSPSRRMYAYVIAPLVVKYSLFFFVMLSPLVFVVRSW